MKQWYLGVCDWLNYVRNYKEAKNNEEITDGEKIELNKKIKKLQKELKDREYIAKEKDSLLELKEKRIEAMGNKISSYAKRCDELRSVLNTTMDENKKLTEKVEQKEQARRKNAGAIGGLKARINELEEQLIKANYTIEFYRKSKKPTLEEIKAYELGHREVEKRQKQK